MSDKIWMAIALALVALLLMPERQTIQPVRRAPSEPTRPAPTRQTNGRPISARVSARFVF